LHHPISDQNVAKKIKLLSKNFMLTTIQKYFKYKTFNPFGKFGIQKIILNDEILPKSGHTVLLIDICVIQFFPPTCNVVSDNFDTSRSHSHPRSTRGKSYI
jgi:hypothetical protein